MRARVRLVSLDSDGTTEACECEQGCGYSSRMGAVLDPRFKLGRGGGSVPVAAPDGLGIGLSLGLSLGISLA